MKIEGTADISECGSYRYDLTRKWGDDNRLVMFVGLNPSTADDIDDDPTMERLISFVKDWGYSSFVMTNLFAYRSTDPYQMTQFSDPVGELNDSSLIEWADKADLIVLCWGNNGVHNGRNKDVIKLLEPFKDKLWCFGLNKSGEPTHPLYLSKTTKIQRYLSV